MNIIMVQSNTRIYMHGAFRAGIQSHMIRVWDGPIPVYIATRI